MLKNIDGDLLELAEQGHFDVIVHGCNCFNTMSAGIAKQIKDNHPAAYYADQNTIKGDFSKIGTYSEGEAASGKYLIVNAYTQYDFSHGDDVFEYDAFQKILNKLEDDFTDDTRFGFPLIGCGLAGGNKSYIIKMLEEFAEKRDTTLVIFSQK